MRDAAFAATDDLRSLREGWLSDQTGEILARARESRDADGDVDVAREVDGEDLGALGRKVNGNGADREGFV